jgi:hypothetical protein
MGSRGNPKTGGRKKGTPNRATAAKAAAIAASGLTPLDFMLEVMRDPGNNLETRLTAARSAAPFVHPKLACVELSGNDGGPLELRHQITDEERAEALAEIFGGPPPKLMERT